MRSRIRKYRWLLVSLFVAILTVYYFCLPHKLFNDPYSTVLEASTGELLSARIADDGQWRFPQEDTIPSKFAEALITFEDKRFRDHPGFDIFSLARACRQ